MSFSSSIKDEYCELPWEDLCCIQSEMMAALVCSAKFRQSQIVISTAHSGYAQRLKSMITQFYDTDVQITHGRELYNINVKSKKEYDEIIGDLTEKLGFDALRGTIPRSLSISECCRKAFLRGVFLSGGSLNEPHRSYHLEITTRRLSIAKTIQHILKQEDIHASLIRRSGYLVVYINEGQQISDFLLITGAYSAMLEFESLRVNKSVRNTVNRVVNCDNANTTKIVYTGARQAQAIEYIQTHIGLNTLPDDLIKTALSRIENPELSLKELGELMDPPIGKSGVNHRLKKIEKIANDHQKESYVTGNCLDRTGNSTEHR